MTDIKDEHDKDCQLCEFHTETKEILKEHYLKSHGAIFKDGGDND